MRDIEIMEKIEIKIKGEIKEAIWELYKKVKDMDIAPIGMYARQMGDDIAASLYYVKSKNKVIGIYNFIKRLNNNNQILYVGGVVDLLKINKQIENIESLIEAK